MNARWTGLWILCALLVGCARSATPPAPVATKAATDEFVVGEGISHGNLTIFPITSRTPRTIDRFITLDEGLRTGKVEVLELGALPVVSGPTRPSDANGDSRSEPVAQDAADPFGGPAEGEETVGRGNSVNEVAVINRSDKPLYLMPGEIILGGDQDRTIGQELVIAPDGKPQTIKVFCVEHGRWGGKGEEGIAQLQAFGGRSIQSNSIVVSQAESIEEAAKKADDGHFIGTVGSLSKGGRVAAQDKADQGEVWEAVAADNVKSGVKIASGAFTAQYSEAEAAKRLDPYIAGLEQRIIEQQQVVGVVVAIDGKAESFDIFESTPLFKKLWPKLLKSYAVDAANAAESRENDGATSHCSRKEAELFVHEAIKSPVTNTQQEGELAIDKRDGQKVLLFTARDTKQRSSDISIGPALEGSPADSLGGGMGGGGLGGSVHGFGVAK